MCDVLGVSTSGYYAWLDREPSARDRRDTELTEMIKEIHEESYGTYGSARVHAELKASGEHVGRKRVARLMRAAGLRGVSRRKYPRTTVRNERARPAPDLVDRDFDVDEANELWVTDITYDVIRLSGGCYRCVQPVHRRVVDGQPPEVRTCRRRARNGA